MNKKQIKIPGISCGHCVRTIESEVNALEGIVSVKADEISKMIDVSWDIPQNWDSIKALLVEINYPPEE